MSPEPDIVREFAETGTVRLEAAFPSTGAEQMTDAIWAYPERKAGIRRDDPASWPNGPLGLSWKGLKHNRAFNVLVDNDAVRTALDALFGPSQWLQPNPGAQVLLTLPRPGAWMLPGTWHMDCGFERPSWPVHVRCLVRRSTGPRSSRPRRCDATPFVGGEGAPNVPAGSVAGPTRARRCVQICVQFVPNLSVPGAVKVLVEVDDTDELVRTRCGHL